MDALEFGKVRRRLCKEVGCEKCPITNNCVLGWKIGTPTMDKRIVEAVEKWAAEHPLKTRQIEFLKLFPHASKYANGLLDICPRNLDADFKCHSEDGLDCYECERIYWSEEAE